MKSYELKPTYENLFDTYCKDAIGRNEDIFHFADILNAIDDSCSISLDGDWGSGKTFFVKQVKMFLDANNIYTKSINSENRSIIKGKLSAQKASDYQPQVCVYYDAWENDNDDDPILSIVYSIINSTATDYSFSDNANCLKIAAAILDAFTGKNWSDVITSFQRSDPLEQIRNEKSIEQKIKEFLDELLHEKGNRLIVFIDELDRCKPSFAIKLLERIKHYFSNDRITFVFSINTSELQHAVKRYYGEGFDACRYLDRFFDLRISIPPVDTVKFYQSIGISSHSRWRYDILRDSIIERYHFSLREIAKYVRLMKITVEKFAHNNRYASCLPDGTTPCFCLYYIVPIMLGLKISDTNKYNAFVAGKDCEPLISFSDCFSPNYFNDLLSDGETFNTECLNAANATIVRLDEKLKALYDAIFVENYSDRISYKEVGTYYFTKNTKDTLLRIAGLLSDYADID